MRNNFNDKELLQAKHRLEEAQARNRQKERKARTRRLIQEGAILPEGRTYSPPVKQAVVLPSRQPCALRGFTAY